MSKNLTFKLAELLLAGTGLASASTITTYDIEYTAFQGGIDVSGSFGVDASGNVSPINVQVSGPTTGFNGFFADGPVAFDKLFFNSDYDYFELGLTPAQGPQAGEVILFAPTINPLTPNNVLLLGGASGNVSSVEIGGGATNFIEDLTSGYLHPNATTTSTPTSTMPEPMSGAMVLLGAVLLATGRELVRRFKGPRQPALSAAVRDPSLPLQL